MFKKIFKKKPSTYVGINMGKSSKKPIGVYLKSNKKLSKRDLERVMVYAKILELSQQYMSYDYVNNKRKFIEKEKEEMEDKKVSFMELIKMVKDGVIKENENIISCEMLNGRYIRCSLEHIKKSNSFVEMLMCDEYIIHLKEIDIQAIEEINFISGDDENDTDIANKVNEVIKAIKQIDKEMKRNKENS